MDRSSVPLLEVGSPEGVRRRELEVCKEGSWFHPTDHVRRDRSCVELSKIEGDVTDKGSETERIQEGRLTSSDYI